MFIVVGLGNPGEEYTWTRHNTGRILLDGFRKLHSFPDWSESKNANALYTQEKIKKQKVELMLPETFMNKSGVSVKYAVQKHKIKPENVIVVYDDIDLPLGSIKISYGRGSGGHNGVASIIKGLGTKDFLRLRVGVSPMTAGGKTRKPKGEKKVLDFLLGDFRKTEREKLKKVSKQAYGAIEMLITDGVQSAMNTYH